MMEQNIDLLKRVLERLAKEHRADSAHILVSRASLITNMPHGSTVLRSFQMGYEYSPSIIELPAKIVSEELFQAHIQLTLQRALIGALLSRIQRLLTQNVLQAGTQI